MTMSEESTNEHRGRIRKRKNERNDKNCKISKTGDIEHFKIIKKRRDQKIATKRDKKCRKVEATPLLKKSATKKFLARNDLLGFYDSNWERIRVNQETIRETKDGKTIKRLRNIVTQAKNRVFSHVRAQADDEQVATFRARTMQFAEALTETLSDASS